MTKETNSKKILKTNFLRKKKKKRKTYKIEEKKDNIYSSKKKENFTKDININSFVDSSISKRNNDVTIKNAKFVYDN